MSAPAVSNVQGRGRREMPSSDDTIKRLKGLITCVGQLPRVKHSLWWCQVSLNPPIHSHHTLKGKMRKLILENC